MTSVADRIGLFPGLDQIAGHPFWVTLAICWAITPGMMIVLGLIGESRLIPLSPSRQFVAFFPGDLFLGLGVASALEVARGLPEGMKWYSAPVVHILVLAGGVVTAFVLTRMEYTGGIYPLRALLSPTKLYHNVVLYVGYGYVAVLAVLACVASGAWRDAPMWTVLTLIGFGIWGVGRSGQYADQDPYPREGEPGSYRALETCLASLSVEERAALVLARHRHSKERAAVFMSG